MSDAGTGVSRSASAWIRQNVLGLIAIFIALSGTAVATQVAQQHGDRASKAAKGKRGPRGFPGPGGPQGIQGPPGPATGPASGALTGNYPNPQIVAGAVGAAELADFSIGPSKYATDTPSARVTNSANESIPNATPTVLTFDTERFDFRNMHDNATDNSRLVASQGTGTSQPYVISATVQFAASATGERSVTLRLNGNTNIATDTRSAAGSGPTTITITTVRPLGDGAYVEVLVNQNSTGALDVVKADEFSPEFAMSLLPGASD